MKKDPLQDEVREWISRLPDAPVPSNFTGRVLQAIDLEESRRSRPWHWNWHVLLPRITVATAILLFTGLTFHHYEQNAHRTAFAKNVALFAEAQVMPGVEALKNFDVIQRMSQPAHADEDLLALLQ